MSRRGGLGGGRWAVPLILALLVGCASPRIQAPGPEETEPRLEAQMAVMSDGYRLPLQLWEPPGAVAGVAVGVHGINDYHRSFADLGPVLARWGIAFLAYDQRGFGATEQRGIWPGSTRLVSDLHSILALLAQRYPGAPVYLVGESMGGAVALLAVNQIKAPAIAGVVLIAPAVWGRDQMPPLQSGLLWLLAHTVPSLPLTGRGLGIKPSDNDGMLERFRRDPLVIKETRVDALWGVTDLMDEARILDIPRGVPALLLYGEQDQIIPKRALCDFLTGWGGAGAGRRIVLYPKGYHMLTRDLQGEAVLKDLAVWVLNREAPLPSASEVDPTDERLSRFCQGGRSLN